VQSPFTDRRVNEHAFPNHQEKSMNANRTSISRAVAAAILAKALLAGTGSVLSQPSGEGGRGHGPRAAQMSEADRAQMRERMQARIGQRLDRRPARNQASPAGRLERL
jgi:hypothetical protein